MSLGRRPKNNDTYKSYRSEDGKSAHTTIGARGVALHLGAFTSSWPIFDHLLPEIAFAGHSNCGKSTLINALAGIEPKKGPASVSDRAGWTERVSFYRIGKKPPILTLVSGLFNTGALSHVVGGLN